MFLKSKARKRILLINYEMTYTGSPRALYNLAKVLVELKYDVDVCTLNSGMYEKEFNKIGIGVKEIDLEYVKRNNSEFVAYDFVICNTIFCLEIAYYLQNIVNTALFIMEAANLKQLMKNCCLDEMKLCNIKKVFCVSEYAMHEIQKEYNLKNISILHNYVINVKKRFNIHRKNEKIKFIVSGTIEERKAQDIAIKAYYLLSEEQREKSELYILGASPIWSAEYQEKIEGLITDGIHVLEAIKDSDELYDFYNEMDVFLIPSRDESCSLVALEAAMLKKPIIVSENVGAKYLLCNKKENIVHTNDETELAKVMMKYVDNSHRIAVDGIKNYFSYKKMGTEKVLKREINRIVRD